MAALTLSNFERDLIPCAGCPRSLSLCRDKNGNWCAKIQGGWKCGKNYYCPPCVRGGGGWGARYSISQAEKDCVECRYDRFHIEAGHYAAPLMILPLLDNVVAQQPPPPPPQDGVTEALVRLSAAEARLANLEATVAALVLSDKNNTNGGGGGASGGQHAGTSVASASSSWVVPSVRPAVADASDADAAPPDA